jgi:hypothetical protein
LVNDEKSKHAAASESITALIAPVIPELVKLEMDGSTMTESNTSPLNRMVPLDM